MIEKKLDGLWYLGMHHMQSSRSEAPDGVAWGGKGIKSATLYVTKKKLVLP